MIMVKHGDKQYNPKIIKIGLYLGYDDSGIARKKALQAYAKKHNRSVADLILDALKARYKDIGL